MYLYRKTYVQQWEHIKPEKQFKVTVKRGGKPFPVIKPERISYVTERVAYWRKANAIHKWFVDNCQDGVDDCREAYVSRGQLIELRDLCLQVINATELVPAQIQNGSRSTPEGGMEPIMEEGHTIADPRKAHKLLPTASGFFFGSPDYDQYYAQDVRETAEVLTALLAEPDGENGDFYYHSSW